MRFTLLVASREEWAPCRRRFSRVRRLRRLGPVWEVQGFGCEGDVVVSGMGPARAAAGLAALETLPPPQWLISAGFGGALQADPLPGQVQVAAAVWQYDPAAGGLELVGDLPPPAGLISYLQERQLPVSCGPVVSTPGILPKEVLRPACQALAAPVVDLESASAAAYARQRGLGFVGLRAVTDGGPEEIAPFLAELIAAAGGVPLGPLVGAVLKDWRRLGYLLHLRRRALQAGQALADTLMAVLTFLAAADEG